MSRLYCFVSSHLFFSPSSLLLLLALVIFTSSCTSNRVDGESNTIDLLILSGRNNHDWEATTEVLRLMCSEREDIVVSIIEKPDTLTFETLKRFDVILSNWNSWPEDEFRWPKETENGLLQFVEDGGGLVFFHASTSAFYEWPEFKQMTTAAWIDSTHHGPMSPVRVAIDDHDHPITRQLDGFYVFDELWIDAEQNDSFQTLGTASTFKEDGSRTAEQPAIFAKEYGEGRIFHTILGHDARSLRNTGLQTLLLRGIEWAATGDVQTPAPQDVRRSVDAQGSYSWMETDTTVALIQGDDIVWQYNYNTFQGKPFFHPVYVDGQRVTSLSPDDHIWHVGQWFSWKYINGVNYWEYVGDGYEAEGVTDITSVTIEKHPDFSAEITLDIAYHPIDDDTVLQETRRIHIWPPSKKRIVMEYSFSFQAIDKEVLLDRTPILGEPEGFSWGGYAGLSIRFNQDFMSPRWLSATSTGTDMNGLADEWLYMGFDGPNGSRVGSAIFISDETRRIGETWYLIADETQPFYFFTPAYLYLEPLLLQPGEEIRMEYRVLHLSGEATRESLQDEYEIYQER